MDKNKRAQLLKADLLLKIDATVHNSRHQQVSLREANIREARKEIFTARQQKRQMVAIVSWMVKRSLPTWVVYV